MIFIYALPPKVNTYTIYSTKFGVSKIFFIIFETSLFCLPRLHLFNQKYRKNVIFKIKWPFKITVFCLECISVIKADWIFSIISPVFSVTWSFRNHSNILMWCLANIYSYYQCLILLCCLIFLWKPLRFFFNILLWIESSKEKLFIF